MWCAVKSGRSCVAETVKAGQLSTASLPKSIALAAGKRIASLPTAEDGGSIGNEEDGIRKDKARENG